MIKRRNLDNSLIQWIMGLTGLGPGIGEIHYLVPVGSSTSNFYEYLQNDLGIGPEFIHHTLANAENALTAYRNDIILAFPGAYLETAALAWDKAQSHIIGLGGVNQGGDYSEPNVVFYTSGTSIANVINITGQNSQFHNVSFANTGNNAACLSAVLLNIYGCLFSHVGISGNYGANQNSTVAAASLYIAGSGMYPIFERCVIGQNVWGTRAAALSGVLRFTGTSTAPQNGEFIRCKFLSMAETATVAMVALPANNCIDRNWLFDNCHFANFSVNSAVNLNQVFYDNCGTTHNIMLHHCSALGIDEWQDADQGNNYIGSDMPIVGVGGGLARNPTAVTGS